MPQKILFVAPSAGVLGGIPDWLDYLMPGLTGKDWECVLGLVEGRFHRVEPYLARHPWHQVERIANPSGSREGRVEAIRRVIEKTRPDVVASANILDVYAAVRRIRRLGRPAPRVLMTLHGLEEPLLDDIHDQRDVLDAVVVTNRLSEKLATIATGNPARVFYAAYGVPESGANTSAALPRDAIRLLYSGRLENDQKRVMDLAGMMQALVRRGVNASLSIAGGGPAGGEFREGLARLGVQDRVHFLGVLEPRRLAEEYAAHAALVITSSWETGPIVAWEAMSHGLPVISTRYIGSGLEGALVHGENCLLFSVGDVAAAADCVAMLRDRLLVERIVLGGRALVADRYSRAASVRQWHEALTAILALPLLPTPGEDPEHRVRSRLDRLLGLAWAERIRRWSGLHYRHRDKGGEWPHSAHRHSDLQAWRANLALLDVGPDGPSRSAAL